MIQNHTNVVVYVANALSAAARNRLETVLGAQPGVARANASLRARQLAIVTYDPGTTSALAILRAVQASGFEARLIGM